MGQEQNARGNPHASTDTPAQVELRRRARSIGYHEQGKYSRYDVELAPRNNDLNQTLLRFRPQQMHPAEAQPPLRGKETRNVDYNGGTCGNISEEISGTNFLLQRREEHVRASLRPANVEDHVPHRHPLPRPHQRMQHHGPV